MIVYGSFVMGIDWTSLSDPPPPRRRLCTHGGDRCFHPLLPYDEVQPSEAFYDRLERLLPLALDALPGLDLDLEPPPVRGDEPGDVG